MNDVVTEVGQSYVALTGNTSIDPAVDASSSGGNWALMAASGTANILGTSSVAFSSGTSIGADCTLGSVILSISPQYATNYLPADGRFLEVSEYPVLAGLLGATYGGDGINNFALPDLRAAAPNKTQYLVCVTGLSPSV
jgi:hypothetical protein